MHICVAKLTIIGSDNGRHQAIIWTSAGILLNGPLGTNFSEISIRIQSLSFKEMHLKMSSGKWRPFCRGLNVLTLTEVYPLFVSRWMSTIFIVTYSTERRWLHCIVHYFPCRIQRHVAVVSMLRFVTFSNVKCSECQVKLLHTNQPQLN